MATKISALCKTERENLRDSCIVREGKVCKIRVQSPSFWPTCILCGQNLNAFVQKIEYYLSLSERVIIDVTDKKAD